MNKPYSKDKKEIPKDIDNGVAFSIKKKPED